MHEITKQQQWQRQQHTKNDSRLPLSRNRKKQSHCGYNVHFPSIHPGLLCIVQFCDMLFASLPLLTTTALLALSFLSISFRFIFSFFFNLFVVQSMSYNLQVLLSAITVHALHFDQFVCFAIGRQDQTITAAAARTVAATCMQLYR